MHWPTHDVSNQPPPHEQEPRARRIAQRLVLALQASLMAAHAEAIAASVFLASRSNADHGQIVGLLAFSVDDCPRIITEACMDPH